MSPCMVRELNRSINQGELVAEEQRAQKTTVIVLAASTT